MLHQVKINHESQRSEGLAKNFQLLREVNENIELVQRIYSQIGEEYVSFMKANSSDVPENLPQSNDGEDQST
jgi:5-bromo-4-chloroindolyl phosphate hydrolysis protein